MSFILKGIAALAQEGRELFGQEPAALEGERPAKDGQYFTRKGRPIHYSAEFGEYSERSVTFPYNDKWLTFPSVLDEEGTVFSEDDVADFVRKNGPVDPITGEIFPFHDTQEAAVQYAKHRSSSLDDKRKFVPRTPATAPQDPPPAPEPKGPTLAERLRAGWTENRILKDQWGRAAGIETDYIDELVEAIPPEYMTEGWADYALAPQENRHDWLLQAIRAATQADGTKYGNLPKSIDEFEKEVQRRRMAELQEVQDILRGTPGDAWGVPEFVGAMGADLTSPVGLGLMVVPGLGAAGTAGRVTLGSAARFSAFEGVMSGAEEGLSLPAQFRVAEDLDQPAPQPGRQILGATVAGAGLAGALSGLGMAAQRFVNSRRAADEAEADRRPEGVTPLQHRRELDQAAGDLRTGRPAADPDRYQFDWDRHRTDGGLRDDAISRMRPNLRSGLEEMISAAPPRIREGLQVYSGYRSPDLQARLWAGALKKYGSPQAARQWVAPPGKSNHNHGQAADLKWNGLRIDQAPADVRDWLHRNAGKYGLHFPLGNEPWHIEPLGTRGTAPARPRDAQPGKPLTFSDFDFTPKGNASPTTNPIGYVFGRLLERGYTPEQAAGIVGNLMQESTPRLNTAHVGDGGNSIGMGQWNGPRRHALLAYAREQGKDWRDLDTQIDFLDHELRTSERAAGDAIRAAKTATEAARIGSERFWRPGIPRIEKRMGYAEDLMEFFAAGRVPRYPGARSGGSGGAGGGSFTGYTSRGYTATGQVTAGDGMTVDVAYQVVDLAKLKRASGELQPRDRTRAASDEQIAELAARLDPARLMPSPEADRGAPIVGGDDVIESGNGRVMALERAYDQHPDRASAYRQQIETAGFDIPADVDRPVLIARRTSELSDADRQGFVRAANQSQIARMSATERARMDARQIDARTVGLFDPRFGLRAPENSAFTRRVLDALPQAERSGLVDAGGKLNAEGALRIRQALFARAYDAPDLLARYTETGEGPMKSLMTALELAAPDWAAMRAAVADGRLRPEMDITPFVLDAMRLIALARDTAARDGGKVAEVLDGLLADIDLLEGAVPPLTVALVRKFVPKGRAAPAEKIADFLKRYAKEAQKIGGTEAALFDAPGPLDALKAIDGEAFGELTETGRAASAAPPAEPAADPLPQTPVTPEQAEAVRDQADASLRDSLPEDLREGAEDLEIRFDENGPSYRLSEILDDLDADEVLETVVDLCGVKGAA